MIDILKKSLPGKTAFVVSIGVFDGIHKGHQYLIRKLLSSAKKNKAKSLVVTFWPHPRHFLDKNFSGHIMGAQQKDEIFSRLGVDYVWHIKTTKKFLKIPGDKFLKRILSKLNVVNIVVGDDFKFGKGGLYKIDDLKNISLQYGFKLTVVKKRFFQNKAISSSRIRDELSASNFKKVNALLDREHVFYSKVIKGKGLGKKIGFPTANLQVKGFVLPSAGVYAVKVFFKKKEYLGACHIGYKPTIKGKRKISLEAYILNFKKDIVGQIIGISFIKKIRNEYKFSSIQQLSSAILGDVKTISTRYSR